MIKKKKKLPRYNINMQNLSQNGLERIAKMQNLSQNEIEQIINI